MDIREFDLKLKQNVAFDLDGTLVDLMPVFEHELVKHTGVEIVKNGRFDIETYPRVPARLIMNAFERAYGSTDAIKPLPGAIDLLETLYGLTHEPPLIVTARPHWAATKTYELLDRFLTIPYRLILTNGGMKKLPYLCDVDHFVDDQRKTALELSFAGKYVYVPERDYNRINFPVDNIEFITELEELIPDAESLCKMDVRYA